MLGMSHMRHTVPLSDYTHMYYTAFAINLVSAISVDASRICSGEGGGPSLRVVVFRDPKTRKCTSLGEPEKLIIAVFIFIVFPSRVEGQTNAP